MDPIRALQNSPTRKLLATEIAMMLGKARREGRNWRCCCPLHGGRSLMLRDGEGGRLLVKCWGGCDSLAVLLELRRRGLLDAPIFGYAPRGAGPVCRDDSRTAGALRNWRKASAPTGTIVEIYLASRGIALAEIPPSLRFHPSCPCPKHNGNLVPPLPAMVALVEHVAHGVTGVHCTYLRQDGSRKAEIPMHQQRACFGRVGGGAIRFGIPRPGNWFAVGEGIETTLSIVVTCSMPAWAAISATGIEKLILPPEATHVVICADNDANGRGQRAARTAAQRWLGEGRRVKVAMPPETGTDFNTMLHHSTATARGGSHVGV
jgi:putative DNA primase/helicase